MSRILIVEDHEGCRELLATALTFAGYQVLAVQEGERALEEARHFRPALIILDLMMPGMDGFEFRVRQMRDPQIADIRVVCCSAVPVLGDAAAAIGATAWAQKPIDPVQFVELVRSIVPPGAEGTLSERARRARQRARVAATAARQLRARLANARN